MLHYKITLLVLTGFLYTSTLSRDKLVKNMLGPHFEDNDTTTCEQFRKHANFNPYSVLNDKWMVFYYWAAFLPNMIFSFKCPSKYYRDQLMKYFDGHVNFHINWTAPVFLMKEHYKNDTVLLVKRGERGMFALYPIVNRKKNEKIYAMDICFKQSQDNKYIAFMMCSEQKAYALARITDVPRKKQIQEIVSHLGFRSRGGRSYLYQGHSWMPIPEADEEFGFIGPTLE